MLDLFSFFVAYLKLFKTAVLPASSPFAPFFGDHLVAEEKRTAAIGNRLWALKASESVVCIDPTQNCLGVNGSVLGNMTAHCPVVVEAGLTRVRSKTLLGNSCADDALSLVDSSAPRRFCKTF